MKMAVKSKQVKNLKKGKKRTLCFFLELEKRRIFEGKAAVEKLRKNKKEKRDARRQKRARLLSLFSLSLSLSLSLSAS